MYLIKILNTCTVYITLIKINVRDFFVNNKNLEKWD